MASLLKKASLRRSNRSIPLLKDDTSQTASSMASEELRLACKLQAEADCMKEITDFFRNFGVRLPEDKVFRYACFYNFDAEEAIEAIREDNYNPYLNLKMKDLEESFLEGDAVFPIPHMKANDTDVVYIRPSRSHGNNNKFVESLCYVLNDLSRTEKQCRKGITVIADMQDITKENFDKEQCKKLIDALQGVLVPTRVETFLIVSPPQWFDDKIWKHMKDHMSREFAKRVHVIRQERLDEFLMNGYELYLPDDFCLGLAHANEICEDYVDLKMFEEQEAQ